MVRALTASILGFLIASIIDPLINSILGYSMARMIDTLSTRILCYIIASMKHPLIARMLGYAGGPRYPWLIGTGKSPLKANPF
jgi:hypothetical protein